MRWEVIFRATVAVGILLGAVFLGLAIWDIYPLMPETGGDEALRRLGESGVEQPVTAVLLNFRAYDTLLEIVVLMVAFWGAWSLRIKEERGLSRPPDLVLDRVSALLVPLLVMLAIYLLWAGSHQAGGEFQAGAVLGAAGILSLLVGRPVPGAGSEVGRNLMVVAGVSVFVVSATIGFWTTGHFLSYPPGWESWMMYPIEIAAMVSIGFILVALFAGSAERLVSDVEYGAGDEAREAGDDD